MQVCDRIHVLTKNIITSFYWTSTADISWCQLIKWGYYIFGWNMDSNLHLHGKKGFSWFGPKTAELDSWKWPISQPHQKFWVHLGDDSYKCGNPKSEGEGSAGHQLRPWNCFLSAAVFSWSSAKVILEGGTSFDQSLQMFHWCFCYLSLKCSSKISKLEEIWHLKMHCRWLQWPN